ncbi:MAG: hypothetical protein GKS06_17455 [Acidobacteria bacterium]|nr:hypothetical protein [Acidobacteriota bacterium]
MDDERAGWLQGTGWLLVGLVLAALSVAGVFAPLGRLLDGFLPVGWARIFAATGWLALGAALYFRSHWVATLTALDRDGPPGFSAARRLDDIASEIERSAHVIGDNLVELESGSAQRELYLDGAQAHAKKLQQTSARVRGVSRELTSPRSVD